MASTQCLAPNDWLAHPELLPPRPQTFTEAKYTRLFAVDLHGRSHHDQYVFFAPNGLAVVGIAPSHPLIAAHRRATGYKPILLRYVPPQLDTLAPEELAATAADDEAQDDAAMPANNGQANQENADPESVLESGLDASVDAGASSRPERSADTAMGPDGADGRDNGGSASVAKQSLGSSHPEVEPFPLELCAAVNFGAAGPAPGAAAAAASRKRGRGGPGGGGGGGGGKPRHVRAGALLARVERTGGGTSFPLWAACGGQLMELNDRLRTNPALLYDRPCREGYLAILSPGAGAAAALLSSGRLVCEADYLRLRGLSAEDLL